MLQYVLSKTCFQKSADMALTPRHNITSFNHGKHSWIILFLPASSQATGVTRIYAVIDIFFVFSHKNPLGMASRGDFAAIDAGDRCNSLQPSAIARYPLAQ